MHPACPVAYLDLELTGLDPRRHEVLEIAVLKRETDLSTRLVSYYPFPGWVCYHRLVAPKHIETASQTALDIVGYTETEWYDAVSLESVLAELPEVLDHSLVIGHNVWLDCQFLAEGFIAEGREPPPWKYRVDSASLIWEHLGPLGHDTLSLAAACEVLGVSNNGQHRAVADVCRTREVVRALTRARLWSRLRWRYQIWKRGRSTLRRSA